MLFFLPLLVHVLAGLSSVIIGIVTFSVPKRRRIHSRWGRYYLWAYSVVFFTAVILSFEHWQKDAYLFFTSLVGYSLVLVGYTAGGMRRNTRIPAVWRKRWVSLHILTVIGSYVTLLTAFLVDNADQIPLLNRLPSQTLWFIPGSIGIPFLFFALSRYAPKKANMWLSPLRKKEVDATPSLK